MNDKQCKKIIRAIIIGYSNEFLIKDDGEISRRNLKYKLILNGIVRSKFKKKFYAFLK